MKEKEWLCLHEDMKRQIKMEDVNNHQIKQDGNDKKKKKRVCVCLCVCAFMCLRLQMQEFASTYLCLLDTPFRISNNLNQYN